MDTVPVKTTQTQSKIIYPTRANFVRYAEELLNPQIRDTAPKLVKRTAPAYLTAKRSPTNPYTNIRLQSTHQLQQKTQSQHQAETKLLQHASEVGKKLPHTLRQRHTAAAKVRDIVHAENLDEIKRIGKLFGPNDLVSQPLNSLFTKLPLPSVDTFDATGRQSRVSEALSNRRSKLRFNSSDTGTENLFNQQATSRSSCAISTRKPSNSQESSSSDIAQGDGVRHSLESSRSLITAGKGVKNYQSIEDFILDRRRICLLQLAAKTKTGECARLDKVLQIEEKYLKQEELNISRKHEEHDKYLKSVCQKTAEAIQLAEEESRKRNDVSKKIKRARYKLAHLNAECVKMEEEFGRLSTYKDFLQRVAETFLEEHTQQTSKSNQIPSEELSDRQSYSDLPSTNDEMNIDGMELSTTTRFFVPRPITDSSSSSDQDALRRWFKDPQALVDIYADLESNNLTLIENVLEQEEFCDRLRGKFNVLQVNLGRERASVDEHINREEKSINTIKLNIDELELLQKSVADITLLDQYRKVFNLGDMKQLQILTNELLQPQGQGQASRGSIFNPNKQQLQQRRSQLLAMAASNGGEVKLTIPMLLNILQTQVQRVSSAVYGTGEVGAKLDTLTMLKRLEGTIDELAVNMSSFPREVVVKAKKQVDERYRTEARNRQKVEGLIAHEARLKKAILKAREKPRWHFGRRVMERSKPPGSIKQTKKVTVEAEQIEDDERSLFQY